MFGLCPRLLVSPPLLLARRGWAPAPRSPASRRSHEVQPCARHGDALQAVCLAARCAIGAVGDITRTCRRLAAVLALWVRRTSWPGPCKSSLAVAPFSGHALKGVVLKGYRFSHYTEIDARNGVCGGVCGGARRAGGAGGVSAGCGRAPIASLVAALRWARVGTRLRRSSGCCRPCIPAQGPRRAARGLAGWRSGHPAQRATGGMGTTAGATACLTPWVPHKCACQPPPGGAGSGGGGAPPRQRGMRGGGAHGPRSSAGGVGFWCADLCGVVCSQEHASAWRWEQCVARQRCWSRSKDAH